MGTSTSINRELGVGEVVSKVFELYRNRFVEYFVLFLVVEAAFAILMAIIRAAANFPALGTNPTPAQVSSWFASTFATIAVAGLLLFVAAIVVFPIAIGGAIRMASEEVEGRKVDIMPSISFAASKLLQMWALGIIVGLIVIVGFIALVIPGIILAIMFSLVLPAVLIENKGVLESMSRSRELVSGRWLKTFAVFLILAIISIIASAILGLIAAPFGSASSFVSTVLGAFTAPIFPIAITVYYYSNLARKTPAPASMGQMGAPAPMAKPGMKFCPNCGTEMASSATFCPKCGAKQPM